MKALNVLNKAANGGATKASQSAPQRCQGWRWRGLLIGAHNLLSNDTSDGKLEELPAPQALAIPDSNHVVPPIARSPPVFVHTESASTDDNCEPSNYSPTSLTESQLPASSNLKNAIGNEGPMVTTDEKENIPSPESVQGAESDPRPAMSYNPMNTLAAAAARVKVIAPPPPPRDESKVAGTSEPAADTESKGGPETGSSSKTRTKFRPSGTKNGRWLKHIDKEGTKDEFQVYYNKLTKAQREASQIYVILPSAHTRLQAYDEEAKDLVEKNSWVKATIEKGTLHCQVYLVL
ncbi:hypothetical protein EDD15DRAFT_2369104 [Pisolithus albus]|nr:hypothetical protein EDD15DRAFT_2369104 [Pisolithus albus]